MNTEILFYNFYSLVHFNSHIKILLYRNKRRSHESIYWMK